MSQWTHVNASIRYDGIVGLTPIVTEETFGKMCKWGDEDDSHWDNSPIPCGSEGGLEYQIIKTGIENSVAYRAVIFTGDLRDYDDEKEILDYFKMITNNHMVRSGVLEINIEFKDTVIYRYDTESGKWVESARINS